MSGQRIICDMYFKDPISKEATDAITLLETAVSLAAKFAVNINNNKDNMELTTIASKHQCAHDDGGTCTNVVDLTAEAKIINE